MNEKIKSFFKKYWGYIVTFFAGVATVFLYDRTRNKRLEDNIGQLEQRLAEYEKLNNRLEQLNTELTKQVGDFNGTNTELRTAISNADELARRTAENITRAKDTVGRIRESITGGVSDTKTISDITDKLQSESSELDKGFEQLEGFLEKYGTST